MNLKDMFYLIKTVNAPGAPAAVGPYSHARLAVKTSNTLYCSGQLGLDPATGALAQGIEAQTRQALENLGAVLRAAGMDYGNVVKTTVFLADIADFGAVNQVYAQYFSQDPPARSCVQAAALPKGGLVEIEAVAVL